MKVKAGKVIEYILLLGLSAVLLWFAFRHVNWGEFWTDLKNCRWEWVVAMMLLQCLITLMRGERWRLMMRPLTKELKVRETYDAYAICYLANLAFPRSGEVVRCGLIAETRKTHFEGALGSVVIERTWDILCTFLCCIPLLFFGRFRDYLNEKMFKPLAESMHIGWLWIALAAVAVIAGLVWLIRANRERISRSKVDAAILSFFRKMWGGITSAFRMERKWVFFGYTLLIWVSYWLCSLWTIYALPAADGMTGSDALFLMVVGSLGWIIPVPGGFGAYHGIISVTLMSIYGFSQTNSLAFAAVSHEAQVVQMLIIGLISLVSWGLMRRTRRKSAETENDTQTNTPTTI
ncbi:MAG: flippase-like domain-containing protein [Bacteroidales bacterium]|nr:flippase-like domain-containing protein [Bacteroidales bacterium]